MGPSGFWQKCKPVFIELHASSAFSFLEAASLPEALVERAAALGYSALALVDRDGVYGAPRFHKAAKAAGIKAIIGCEITIGDWGLGTGGWGQKQEAGSKKQEDRIQKTEERTELAPSAKRRAPDSPSP